MTTFQAPNERVYETAQTLRVVAQMFVGIADALEQDDEIMGSICSQGLVYNLPALPKHIRDVIAEWVSDEAAASAKADAAYLDAEAAAVSARETAT